MRRSFLRLRPLRSALAAAWILVALAGLAVAAGPDTLIGSSRLALERRGESWHLRFGERERPVAIPAGTTIERLVPLASGAAAAVALGEQDRVAARTAGADGADGADRAEGTELYVALVTAEGLSPLPAPPGRVRGAAREQGVALAGAGGELDSVAWLEGVTPRALAVRAARWTGASWSEPEEVAPAAPGSQQALAGARLDDGTTLLVWARFDGEDDEIVASFGDGSRWSAPLPVAPDNRVPDIVPAVAAIPGGALVAWSRYDGHDYRVVVSRWNGERWSAPEERSGAGGAYPTLERGADGARLLFATAKPAGWEVVELANDGRARRRATVATSDRSRPILDGDALRWTGDRRPLLWR